MALLHPVDCRQWSEDKPACRKGQGGGRARRRPAIRHAAKRPQRETPGSPGASKRQWAASIGQPDLPDAGRGARTREQVYKEIEGVFGLVPSFFKEVPDSSLELEWKLFKKVQLDEGPIPNKYRELI